MMVFSGRIWAIMMILLHYCSYPSDGYHLSPSSSFLFHWRLPLGKLNQMLDTTNNSSVETCVNHLGNNDLVHNTPSGIINLRNTCYMNSVLQSLFHCLPFRHALSETSFEESSVAYATQQLFKALASSQSNDNSDEIVFCMKELVNRLEIDTRIQEDAQEFFLKLINAIDESKTIDGSTNPKIKGIFTGSMNQVIECLNVNFNKTRSQKFLDLSIKVDGNEDLIDGIYDLLKLEMLVGENQYKAGVHGYQDATRRCIIDKLPEVLFVHLKRFEYDSDTQTLKKIGSAMSFPFELDLSELDKEKDKSAVYDLVSVIVHEGSLSFGHYTSLSRVELSQEENKDPSKPAWYEFNDHVVNRIQEDDVKKIGFGETRRSIMSSKNAYLLLYVRRKT
jgi:ubiquitin C-terminal hydrolase